MVRSLPHPSPSLFADLDARRIAGNSIALLVHVVALGLLMMPSSWEPAPAAPKPELVVVIQETVKPKPIPITEPPKTPEPVTPQVQPRPQPVATPTPVVEQTPVVSEGSELATPDVVAPPVISYDTGPSLATLAYDVHPAPRYPRQSLRNGHTGTVTLRVLVDAQGRPVTVEVETSSGHRELDRAAREQVLAKWRFHPAQQQGRAVSALALVPIVFALP